MTAPPLSTPSPGPATLPAGPATLPAGTLASGAAAAVPLVASLAPFGLVVGATVAASADVPAAWTGTLLIYSGSAQVALLQLLQHGSAAWAAVLAAVLVNARLAVYSASLAPLWRGTPLRWKLLAAATVVEPTWAVAERRRRDAAAADPADDWAARRHYAGAALAVTVGWLAFVNVGTLVGREGFLLPHLAVGLPLFLVAVIVPHLRLPGGAVAVPAAALTAVAARGLPPGADVLLPRAAAAAAGALAGRRRP